MTSSGQGCAAFPRPNTLDYRHHSTTLLGCHMKNRESIRKSQQRYKRKLAQRLKENPPPPLELDRLLAVIHYDPNTGIFTRIGLSGDRKDLIGKKAGGPSGDGYIRIAVDSRRYRAHRLAWFYMTGSWPAREIDHRNRIRSDNRWVNLREASSAINKHNRSPKSNNLVGLLGVSHSLAGRFKARIGGTHIGVFDTPELAHAAYLKEKRKQHRGFLE